MTNISDRVEQWQGRLGDPLTEELPHPLGGTYQAFTNAVLVDVPGAGCYTFSEASVSNIFTEPLPPRDLHPPPDPTALVEGIDVSSHQPRDLSGIVNSLDPRPQTAIIRLYQELEAPSQEHSLAQIQSAWDLGLSVGSYIWLYAGQDAKLAVRDTLQLAGQIGLKPPVLWLDIEPYLDQSCPNVATIQAAVDECERLGVRPGIYSGAWVWSGYLGGTTAFGHLPLWTADYGQKPSTLEPVHYGNFGVPAIVQWTSDPVDRNVVSFAVTIPPL